MACPVQSRAAMHAPALLPSLPLTTPRERRSVAPLPQLASSIAFLVGIALLLLCGCSYTTTTIAVQDLRAAPAEARALRLHAGEHGDVTVNARSELRFRRRDGSVTRWLGSRQLYLNDEGVVAWTDVPLSMASAAVVEGLPQGAAASLAETAPVGASLRSTGPDAFELDASGDALVAWIDRFILEVARRYTPASSQDPPPWCYGRRAGGSECGDVPADRDRRALFELRERLHGAPLGRWSFDMLSRRIGPFQGKDIFAARSAGIHAIDGLRWQDIAAVEVKNVSPGKTASDIGAQVATGALMAAVAAPIVVASGPSGSPVLNRAWSGSGGDGQPDNEGISLWHRGLEPPSTAGARPLLAGNRVGN